MVVYQKGVTYRRGNKYKSLSKQFVELYFQVRPRSLNTQKEYRVVGRDLAKMYRNDFKLQSVYNLHEKHFTHTINTLFERGYTMGTIAAKAAITRKYFKAAGRGACCKPNSYYGIKREKPRFVDKRWTDGGKSDYDLIKQVDTKYHKYGDQIRHALILERRFGCRKREALQFDPKLQIKLDEKGEPYRIEITKGAKNARHREVPVITKEQKEFCKYLLNRYSDGPIMPSELKYIQFERIYYKVLRAAGIHGEIKGHGLRQAYANDRLNELIKIIGDDEARKGYSARSKAVVLIAYRFLVEELGHSRLDILRNYLENYGSF